MNLLVDILKHAESTHFLELRNEGFLVICRVAPKGLATLKERPRAWKTSSMRVKVLSKERRGTQILQVSGEWRGMMDVDDIRAKRALEVLKSIEREPIYSLRNASFDGSTLRVPLIADEKTLSRLLEEMKRVGVPYRVASLGDSGVREGSALDGLTPRQINALRLAYTMGYYDVPKRARVEDIARLLGLEKGTAGEHLRRAEKHVFDRLLS